MLFLKRTKKEKKVHITGLKMFSLKFKNFSLRENLRRYIIIMAAILFVVF